MSLVCLINQKALTDAGADERALVKRFDDVRSFAADPPPCIGFVVDDRRAGRVIALLRQLRSSALSAVRPVYTTMPVAAPWDQLSDGQVDSLEQAAALALALDRRIVDLDPAVFQPRQSDTFRLLGYLHARPQMELTPTRSWRNEKIYAYPLAEAMCETAEPAHSWLHHLADRKLLHRSRLVDRIRHCPQCDGSHFNFIDICPNCNAIDIAQIPFLHCFTCGKVAPEEQFITLGALQCPHCRARLRHIGADYDRPLENFSCNDCGHVFIEPEVVAHCLHCDTRSAPDDLVARPVYSFALTEQGRMSAKSGALEDVFALLDNINSVSPAYFVSLVNWLLGLCRRHDEERFAIIGIRLKNLLELNEQLGRHQVAALMDTFAGRLRELIRTTDLTTRTSRQVFWILLPKTGDPNYRVVLDRILELRQLAEPGDQNRLQFETTAFCAPRDMDPGETGQLLLTRLEGALQTP